MAACVRPVGLALLLLLVLPHVVTASDRAREKRLAEQIAETVFEGEPFFFKDGAYRYLGIYIPTAESSRRAVLILHGRGNHPDWEQVVQPLRTGLVKHGWDTLSIQLPVLDKQATYYDYIPVLPEAVPRIEAAIRYLREQGNDTIVLIAHSCGVHMAMAWVREKGTEQINGFVGIGMGATDDRQTMQEPFPFEKIDVPVLDLYGALDYPAVLRAAPQRWAALEKQANPHSRQVMLMDADHYMHDQDELLVETVADWLKDTFD